MLRKSCLAAYAVALIVFAGCAGRLPSETVAQLNMDGWQGSGTLVATNGDQALILTCRHVARSIGLECVVTWEATGEKADGTVLDVIQETDGFESDLAFVVCQAPQGISPVTIAKFDPGNGPFTCLGYRGGEFYVSISRHGTEHEGLIRLSAPLIGGMSGGPCFDRYNRLVGVGVGSTATESVAADGEYLVDLVDKYKWDY